MRSIISKTITVLAVTATLVSFTPNFGGEGFEISLNGKVVLQRYGSNIDDVKTLRLVQGSPGDKLTIKYHHCGRVGRNRIVTIKDDQDKLVKSWSFADSNEPVAAMSCNVQDIISLKKAHTGAFRLYYSSTELPKGRLLAAILVGSNIVTANR